MLSVGGTHLVLCLQTFFPQLITEMNSIPRFISRDAIRFITALYHDFKQNRQWTNDHELRNKISPKALHRLITEYEPALFKRQQTNQGIHFELTLYGYLHCKDAKDDVLLLEQAVGLLKDLCIKDPNNPLIAGEIIRNRLQLDIDQTHTVRALLSILLHQNDIIKIPNWSVRIPQDIQLLIRGMAAKEYIMNRAEEDIS